MAIRIAQDFAYQGNDLWKWWVWLDGSEAELDQVDYVKYQLHPTFPNPVRIVKDRRTKFRLAASGWGVFRLYAKVVLLDKTVVKLEHDLVLEYPSSTVQGSALNPPVR